MDARVRRPPPAASASVFPPGVVTESEALQTASWYRREPYLIFFPLGIALSWAGVAHWLLHAVGWLETYRPVFHATTQIQAFMTAFAVGFLMTMIPRRTGSAPPDAWEVVVCAGALVVTAAAAWQERWLIAHGAWLALAATLVGFALRRFIGSTSRRRPPNGFVWIPLALAMGIAGSVMSALYAGGATAEVWVYELGRRLVQQGMFVGLVLGVGSLAFPLMTRGVAPPDSTGAARDLRERALHVATAVLLVASFVIEINASLRAGMLLRGVLIAAALLGGAGLRHTPAAPGWNRWLVWTAGWLLPFGYVVATIVPDYHKGALHFSFIGGFALLAMAVSIQVTLGHRGYRTVLIGRPWQIPVIGGLMAAAMAARIAMEIDRARYFVWMGIAAAAFLAATLVWAQLLLPKMLVTGAE